MKIMLRKQEVVGLLHRLSNTGTSPTVRKNSRAFGSCTHYNLISARVTCLLPPASCLLPSASCLLPPAFCLLPSASCLLPSAFCVIVPQCRRNPFPNGSSQWPQPSRRSASPDRNGSLNGSLTASACSLLRRVIRSSCAHEIACRKTFPRSLRQSLNYRIGN